MVFFSGNPLDDMLEQGPGGGGGGGSRSPRPPGGGNPNPYRNPSGFGYATGLIHRSLENMGLFFGGLGEAPNGDRFVYRGGPDNRVDHFDMRAVPPGSRGVAPSPWMRDNQLEPNYDRTFSTFDKEMERFYQLPRKKLTKLAMKLWLAGLVSGATNGLQDANLEDIANAYERLLGMAADRLENGKAISPQQILNRAIEFKYGKPSKGMKLEDIYGGVTGESAPSYGGGSGGGSGGGGGAAGPQYPIKTISRNKVIDLSSPAEAKAFLRDSMMNLLGRDVTDEEVEDFTATLNGIEEENPQITRSKTITRKNGNSNTTTRIMDDGMTSAESAELAEDTVRGKPNYAEYQAAATYFPALMSMLGPVA